MVTILANVLLVVLFMMFLLASGNQLNAKIKIAYAPETASRILGVIGRISDQVRRYLIAKALVSAGTGVLVFLVLLVLGVDFPVFWGFLAFVLNFIPTVGDLVATLLPTSWRCFSLIHWSSLYCVLSSSGLYKLSWATCSNRG